MAEKPQTSDAVVVLVTGAAGQIGYALCPMIASGRMFGPDQPVIIRAVEVDFPVCMQKLKGVGMEMQDCSYPLLRGFEEYSTADAAVAWKDIDYAVLVGGFPRKDGMTRADLLGKNADIFKEAGENLNKYAKSSTKVLVVANPANTNCKVASHFAAPTVPPENFCALTRLDFNRARGLIAARHKLAVGSVKNVFIWGNHSKSQVPDVSKVWIETAEGKTQLADMMSEEDKAYYNEKPDVEKKSGFMYTVAYRGAAVIKQRGASSACSAANAACDCIRDWHCGTDSGAVAMSVSMKESDLKDFLKIDEEDEKTKAISAVRGDSVYFSIPVEVADGKYQLAKMDYGYLTDDLKSMCAKSFVELLTEWQTCQEKLGISK